MWRRAHSPVLLPFRAILDVFFLSLGRIARS
jgi:hypothetical protein